MSEKEIGYYGRQGNKVHDYDMNSPAKSYFDDMNLWDIKKGDLVLDVAAGQGFEAKYIKENFGAKVIETDISPYASKKGVESRVLILADAHKQPFADESFDVVHCKDAIVHLNMSTFFSEVVRILKPNGIVFLTTGYYDDKFDDHDGIMYRKTSAVGIIENGENAGLEYISSHQWYPEKNEKNWNNKSRRVIFTFKKRSKK